MIKSRWLKALPATVALVTMTEQVLACTLTPPLVTPPTPTPGGDPPPPGTPSYWIKGVDMVNGSSGTIFLQLNAVAGVNDTLPQNLGGTGGIGGSSNDSCACALSLPDGTPVDITSASVGRGNINDVVGTFEEYTPFGFSRNSSFDDDFATATFAAASVVQGSPVSSDPADWFAFTDLDGVPAFTADANGINGFELTNAQPYYLLKYDFTSPLSFNDLLDITGDRVQFAAGKLQTGLGTPSPSNGAIAYTNAPPLQAESVPEPTATLSLLSLGILGAGVTLKRKLKRKAFMTQ